MLGLKHEMPTCLPAGRYTNAFVYLACIHIFESQNPMSFIPLGDTLQKKTKGILQKQVEASQAVVYAEEVFAELFSEDLAKHAKPLFLKNRTLTVTCSSSALAQEIRLNQAKIVESINKKLGSDEVDRIRYLA